MEVEVAAWGWLGAAWAEAYPADLPEAWRLDYLANEYEAAVVPCRDWQSCDREMLEGWLEQVPAEFHLYWEVTSDIDPEPLLSLYRSCAGSLPPPAGWLLSYSGRDEVVQTALRRFAPVALCTEGGCDGEAFTVLPAAETQDLRQLRRQLDELAAQGCKRVLLPVRPSAEAAAQLQQLHTFCQLYRG
ncbi:MAG: hypothetical protein OQK94_00645 [Gammaproteobacteria bacterium]|nr:hypothetical protein [Gammaproteobacteria bacterium]MCW8839426.1 hypothetical protein [Gammaproteobacteria bacterium]MCW8959168.1 hypothetical protein [Gammaproteobacteria bacterium]MCW8971898.1 hypothetical protein [Gammaproteobacteria bacterium]MCW8991757.1 hypothetical protein [Gammaproteobacteria bacterium]